MKRALVALSLPLVILIAVAQASAAPVLRFDNPVTDGGALTYDGIGGPLVGTDIIFENVIGDDTPLNDGALLNCAPFCLLNFVSGNNTGEDPYSWNGGGSFTLTGTLVDPNNGNAVVATGTLLDGEFASPVLGTRLSTVLSISGVGEDTKNPDLIAFYGITDPNFVFANAEVSAATTFFGNLGFEGDVTEADLANTAVPTQVPLPGTFMLLALGALGLVARRFVRS
jgi:hypothetical protein